jgi:hypothetical protein
MPDRGGAWCSSDDVGRLIVGTGLRRVVAADRVELFAFDQFSALAPTYYVASLGGSYGKLCRLDAEAVRNPKWRGKKPRTDRGRRAIDGRSRKSGWKISANGKAWPRLPIADPGSGQARGRILAQNSRKSRSAEGMAVRPEWSIKYRAAILERNPASQLLRMTEANDAIQRRMGDVREASDERRKLENALEALNLVRDRRTW